MAVVVGNEGETVGDRRTAAVREKARSLGFDAVAVARADLPLDADFERYRAFVEAERHGEMSWLANHLAVRERLDHEGILAGAKSVICLARRYQRSRADEGEDSELAQSIARYARGRDYHNGIRKKLRRLAAFVRTLEEGASARPIADDAPVLERAWAARAGLGFVGKNGLLIVPGEGSFVLLGEVVTSVELTADSPIPERCGSCTRCLDVCPTSAFVAPFVLDPRRCVAYLTIEHRSSIDAELRDGVGSHLFGCDDCQQVCPFNASARPRPPEQTKPFEPHPRWSELTTSDLLTLNDEQWRNVSEGSPVFRATAEGLARNAAIVLGNRREVAAVPMLERAAQGHPSPVVRDACAWALARMR